MSIICPTITVSDQHAYREQMEAVAPFISRVHIDLMDGKFAPSTSVPLDSIWWPEHLTADVHLMYEDAVSQLDELVRLKPSLVIVHAEVHGTNDLPKLATDLRAAGIKMGLALLQDTKPADIAYLLPHVQHVLVFSGNLGHQGGSFADLELLQKVVELKKLHHWLEVGWDGGVNDHNVAQLASGGVDVINVGGYIQKAENPKAQFQKLTSLLQS